MRTDIGVKREVSREASRGVARTVAHTVSREVSRTALLGALSAMLSAAAFAAASAIVIAFAAPAVASAQGGGSAGGVLRIAKEQSATPYVCAEIMQMPRMLAATPEGRSVVRLQRELDVYSQEMARRGLQLTIKAPGVAVVQRDVDSLARVLELRSVTVDSVSTVVVGGDSANSGGSVVRMRIVASPKNEVEAVIRDLQPRIAALTSPIQGSPFAKPFPIQGWIGIHISGSSFRELTPQGVVTRYCDEYPVVEAVDPGSPAEVGGLLAGDTLIAFNGRDVLHNPIVHTETFAVGKELRVSIRRYGRPHQVVTTVAPPRTGAVTVLGRALPYTAGSCPGCPPIPGAGNVRVGFMASPVQGGDFATVGFLPGFAVGSSTGSTTGAVAGAHVAAAQGDLAQSLEIESGLLVLRVLGGTPMSDAGVRVGEVIRTINGQAATGVSQLQRAFASASREAKLELWARGQQQRTVTVKW